MLPFFSALGTQRWPVRWAVKLTLLAGVVFFTLYPDPRTLIRHVQHVRQVEQLTDPSNPALQPVRSDFETYARQQQVDVSDRSALIPAVERFVYARIPYAWDWETWGVADYLPSLPDMLSKGREDCDGRAVLAAALLRSFDVDARLVADPRHVWVRTPAGDLMQPMGTPVFQHGIDGLNVRWRALLDPAPLAFGLAVFPLFRELIILLAAWVLLLPPRLDRFAAALVLLLLVNSLVIVRGAGADALAPRYAGLGWAAGHWLVAAWMLWRGRGRNSSRDEAAPAHAGREVPWNRSMSS
jgi:hypothetical protein